MLVNTSGKIASDVDIQGEASSRKELALRV